jgi:nucleotide-binding universal stress UspA family protein
MNKIMCPVDLSAASINAMKYAARLAGKTGALLSLLHIQQSEVTVSEQDEAPDQKEAEEEYTRELEKWAFRLEKEFNIRCTWHVKSSVFEKEIIRMANEKNYDLIVMGTEGKKKLEDRLFGSLTYKVVEEVTPPVLVVPADLTDHQIRRIIYSSNYDKADVLVFKKVLDLAKKLKASLGYLHVSPHAEFFGEELFEVAKEEVEEVAREYPEVTISYERLVDDHSVNDALEHYLQHSKADLLVMVTRHRNMLQKLFHKSVTKRLTLSAHYPLLIFHREKEIKK